jgi:hypothetical protein
MEQWAKIRGYEGYGGADNWEVSDRMNVRQFGIPSVPKIDSQGYAYIHLCKGGELVRVHRLYLLTFVGPPPEGHIAVKHTGVWRWGPRDMVHIPLRGRKKALKEKRAPKGPRYGGHFDEWLQARSNKNSTKRPS